MKKNSPHIVDLILLSEDQIKSLINYNTINDFVKFSKVLPDEVFEKILPCFDHQVRTEMIYQKKHGPPILISEIEESENKIIKLMAKYFT